MSNVLVLAPHADDEVLGCGGTIAKHVASGDQVYVAVMTNAFLGAPELFSEPQVGLVRNEARSAHLKLNICETFWFDFPAPQLDQYPLYKIANAIQELIERTAPKVLYVPHKGDLHMDHGVIFTAALVAARPFPAQVVQQILAYETLSETEWGSADAGSVFLPTVYSELTDSQFETKLAAMNCFTSQVKEFPNARSLEAIQHLAAFRGSTVGVRYAEAFKLIREIRK